MRRQGNDMARYFEDFQTGDVVWSPGRTITESDVMAFAGLSGDYNPAHTDYEFPPKGAFRKADPPWPAGADRLGRSRRSRWRAGRYGRRPARGQLALPEAG